MKNALLDVPCIASTKDLKKFLIAQGNVQMFFKPLSGSQGKGCIATMGFAEVGAKQGRYLKFGKGDELPLGKAVIRMRKQLGRRAIAQERIVPHSLLRPICGDTCPTVRLLSSIVDKRVEVFAAILKLPGSGSVVDNLHSAGVSHPIALTPVDPSTGKLGSWRLFNGDSSTSMAPPLKLESIPQWESFIEMVNLLHPLDRGAVLLGWDIAVAEGGPMLVEVNETPGIDLWQFAWGRGFADAEGCRLLRHLDLQARWLRRRNWRRASRLLGLT